MEWTSDWAKQRMKLVKSRFQKRLVDPEVDHTVYGRAYFLDSTSSHFKSCAQPEWMDILERAVPLMR